MRPRAARRREGVVHVGGEGGDEPGAGVGAMVAGRPPRSRAGASGSVPKKLSTNVTSVRRGKGVFDGRQHTAERARVRWDDRKVTRSQVVDLCANGSFTGTDPGRRARRYFAGAAYMSITV